MEAISPRTAAIQEDPIVARSIPQTKAVGPPLYKPAWRVKLREGQVESMVRPKATAGVRLMYLWIYKSSPSRIDTNELLGEPRTSRTFLLLPL